MNSLVVGARSKISIVTPSYNQGTFLERTLRSVIAQNHPNVEHLVIDGGSKDSTVSILQQFDKHLAHWVSEPDDGQTHAVNKGLRIASGDIIGWLNSDDVYYPGAFNRVVNFFADHPEANFVYGMADHIDADDKVLEPYYTEEWDYGRLKQLCFICQPAVFFRRETLFRHGFLNERLNYCMDYEYWLRCGAQEKFHYLKFPLAGSRLYAENKTLGSKLAVNEEIVCMLKEMFGQVDRQWLVSLSLAQARDSFGGEGKFRRFLRAVYAGCLWQKNLMSNNGTILPLVPMEFVARLTFLPEKVRAMLEKPAGTA